MKGFAGIILQSHEREVVLVHFRKVVPAHLSLTSTVSSPTKNLLYGAREVM